MSEPYTGPLFKVLDENMRSCVNPVNRLQWKIGKWHKAKDKLIMCVNGLHLTRNPTEWYSEGKRVFVAEAQEISEWSKDKCVCRKARIIAEVTPQMWAVFKPKRDALDAEFNSKRDALDADLAQQALKKAK